MTSAAQGSEPGFGGTGASVGSFGRTPSPLPHDFISPAAAALITQLQGKVDTLKAKLTEMSEQVLKLDGPRSDLRAKIRAELEKEQEDRFAARLKDIEARTRHDTQNSLQREFQERLDELQQEHAREVKQVRPAIHHSPELCL